MARKHLYALAALAVGVAVYIAFSLLNAPLTLGIREVNREAGILRLDLRSGADRSASCALDLLLVNDASRFSTVADAGVISPGELKVVEVAAEIPEGRFDYDIQAQCRWI